MYFSRETIIAKVGKLSILQVYSDPKVPRIKCSLIDGSGSEKDILTISLQDNGIHVYKSLDGGDHYILPPIPQIGALIREVIEEVAEELNAEAVVVRYGDEESQDLNNLVLSDAWYDIERLALAASKHATISEDFEARIVIGIVRFSSFIYAATVMRKEDTFPLLQVYMDSSGDLPTVRVYNELGQLVEERREKITDFESYVKSLVGSEDVAVVYREASANLPSPREVTTADGSKYYVAVIYRYFLGFLPSTSLNEVRKKRVNVKGRSELSRALRALLYLEKLGEGGGVEVLIGSRAVPLNELPKEVLRLSQKAEGSLRKFSISFESDPLEEPILKELTGYTPEYGSGDVYLGVRVLPVAFLIVAENEEEFSQYVRRIMEGPTSDGYEMLDEIIKKSLSNYFIGYMMSLEEALIIYTDISTELMNDGK